MSILICFSHPYLISSFSLSHISLDKYSKLYFHHYHLMVEPIYGDLSSFYLGIVISSQHSYFHLIILVSPIFCLDKIITLCLLQQLVEVSTSQCFCIMSVKRGQFHGVYLFVKWIHCHGSPHVQKQKVKRCLDSISCITSPMSMVLEREKKISHNPIIKEK